MDGPTHNTSMVVLTPKNYHLWIKEIQKLANHHKVWEYVDPDGTTEEPGLQRAPRVSDYQVKMIAADGTQTTTRSAKSASELTDAQRKAYKADLIDYQVWDKYADKIINGIKAVDDAVKLSARQYISLNEIASPTRKIIQTLASRYKLSDSKVVEQIHERYQELKISPSKQKIEQWISDWENLRSDMISQNLASTFGSDVIFVNEFLRAGRKWAPNFCENWVMQHEAADKSIEFFKTTRYYRNACEAYLKDEMSVRGHANAATLQGKIPDQSDQNTKDNRSKKGARKCVCGEIHEFDECPYIVSSARTSDWTEDKKIVDQIKQKLQEKPWLLRVIKRICNINILDEAITPSVELEYRFGNFSFANTVLKESTSLSKSVIYDSGCSDSLTYDKDRFLGEIKPASGWIKTPNGQMKVEGYGTMQVLGKSGDKTIKMEFVNTAYVPITSMTLVSSTKLIKEGYDRDMHTKTLVHVATGKKVCDIEEHFGVMTLEYNSIPIQPTEYVEYGATVDPRNEMENAASIDLRSSTATVEMTVPKINEVLNETPNKKIEMLNNQASKKHEVLIDQAPKEVEKTPQSITNSESITHGKSDTESHIMELNQSDDGQQNLSLNNPHSSRQIDSGGGGDQFIKASNTNGGRKEHFTKAPNLKNGGLKKQAKSVAKTHHKDSNRTKKAWWRPLTNGVQITPANGVRKRLPIEGFSGGQYGFSKHAHQDMQHSVKLGHKRG